MNVIAKSHQDRIHIRRRKTRTNVEDEDRLSSLPDELIHKILSFVSIGQAIKTSVLSTRWRSIWTSIPSLNFSCEEDIFPNFVSNVLSRHNSQIQVSSVKLVRTGLAVSHESVKRIIEYALSNNVQQLTFTWDFESNVRYHVSPMSSQSLQHLVLSGSQFYVSASALATPTWDLPALTTLHLDYTTLSDKCTGVFSMCTNLNNLSLKGCKMKGNNVLNIHHPRLSSLTLQQTYWWMGIVNVVAPQLKNLTIEFCNGKHMISAPGLTSLVMKGDSPLQLSTQGFPTLEKVDLCISSPLLEDVHRIVSLLQQLHSVKFLTLNVEILELLSLSMGLISHQLFAFANLKILKFSTIGPIRVYLEVRAQEKVTTFTETENYHPDSSPSAIFTVVSCEEIRILRDIVSAQQLIAELRVVLRQCDSPEQMNIERLLVTKLQHIEGMLTELPASKSPAIQATFSSLCEEADIVTNNMLDSMKIRFYKKRKRSQV